MHGIALVFDQTVLVTCGYDTTQKRESLIAGCNVVRHISHAVCHCDQPINEWPVKVVSSTYRTDKNAPVTDVHVSFYPHQPRVEDLLSRKFDSKLLTCSCRAECAAEKDSIACYGKYVSLTTSLYR